jgi:hypothetical protein
MIPNLILTSVPFRGQDNSSTVKNSYKELLKRNEQIANTANTTAEKSVGSNTGKQIPMQGTSGQIGQKLDVIV